MSDTEPIKVAELEALLPPYARAMGIKVEAIEDGSPRLAMAFADHLQGWPGLFHGGTLAGLLEMAGLGAVIAALTAAGREIHIKPINLSTNFLRGARETNTYAHGRVTRLGRRNAHVVIAAWQNERAEPVAEAVMNVLLSGESDRA